MPEIGSIFVKIGADARGLESGLRNAESAVRRTGQSLSTIGRSLSTFLTLPLVAAGGAAVKMAADMEQTRVAFTTLTGSAEQAGRTLKELEAFAASTPFQFPELADASRKLIAFGVSANDSTAALRRIGDVAAGVGAPIGEIAELYGKARVQGRLFAEDINQLTGRGIPIIQELAAQFGVADSEVRKLVESGQVGFANIERAFVGMTSEGGKFFNLMADSAETVKGKFSTLRDNVGAVARELGEEMLPVLARLTDGALQLAQSFRGLDSGTKQLVIGLGALTAVAGPVLVVLGALVRNAQTVGSAFGRLLTFLKANPWVLVTTAVIGFTAALVRAKRQAQETADGIQGAVDKARAFRAELAGLSSAKLPSLSAEEVNEELLDLTRTLAQVRTEIAKLKTAETAGGQFAQGLTDGSAVERRAKLVELRKQEVRLQEAIAIYDKSRADLAVKIATATEAERKALEDAARASAALLAKVGAVSKTTGEAADEAERLRKAFSTPVEVKIRGRVDVPEVEEARRSGALVAPVAPIDTSALRGFGDQWAREFALAEASAKESTDRIVESASNAAVRMADLGKAIRTGLAESFLVASNNIADVIAQFVTLQKSGVESLKAIGQELRDVVRDIVRVTVRTLILQAVLAAITGGGSVAASSFRGKLGAVLSQASGLQLPRSTPPPVIQQVRVEYDIPKLSLPAVQVPVGFAVADLPLPAVAPIAVPVGFAVADLSLPSVAPIAVPVGFDVADLALPILPDRTSEVRWRVQGIPDLPVVPDLTAKIGFDVAGLPALPRMDPVSVVVGFDVPDRPDLPDLAPIAVPVGFDVTTAPSLPSFGAIAVPVGFDVAGLPVLPDLGAIAVPVGFEVAGLPALPTVDSITVPVGFDVRDLLIPDVDPIRVGVGFDVAGLPVLPRIPPLRVPVEFDRPTQGIDASGLPDFSAGLGMATLRPQVPIIAPTGAPTSPTAVEVTGRLTAGMDGLVVELDRHLREHYGTRLLP